MALSYLMGLTRSRCQIEMRRRSAVDADRY